MIYSTVSYTFLGIIQPSPAAPPSMRREAPSHPPNQPRGAKDGLAQRSPSPPPNKKRMFHVKHPFAIPLVRCAYAPGTPGPPFSTSFAASPSTSPKPSLKLLGTTTVPPVSRTLSYSRCIARRRSAASFFA